MRILFIGAVEFSSRALEELINMDADIVGVCTAQFSDYNSDHCDLSLLSSSYSIPWNYVVDINSTESVDWIAEKRPDVIFCFGWSRLLGRRLLNTAPLGVIGFHPSALPHNRGRHPIIWALVLGLKETASTFFFMDEEADRGDILSQKTIGINKDDDAGTLYEKVILCALGQIREFLPQMISGRFPRIPQTGQANSWRKRDKSDGQIDWRMSAQSIYNLVRGLTKPYVGAHFMWNKNEIKVWKIQMIMGGPHNIEPGKVCEITDKGVVVKCGEESILLLKTEPSFCPLIGEYL